MRFENIPSQLAFGVEKVNERLTGTEHITVRFEAADCLTVRREERVLVIGYSRPVEAYRGMSMAGRLWESGETLRQSAKFDTLTLMADCSRNAVLTVESVKDLLVSLAMMGFTSLMLYTEDTYEIPGQPYFGHMRGRYSVQELKELDAYAKALGMELIPCIQTLAHLHTLFNWNAFEPVHDVDDVLIADDPKTYELVEQMLKTCRECFSGKRIHIGLDEAFLLGRGNYIEKYGYSTKTDILLRHMQGVAELCKKYDFEPVMWGDMFFRMQFNGVYHGLTQGELADEVLEKVPEGLAQCYWTYYYYPQLENTLEYMFSQFARMNREVWFAGGCWSWFGYTPKNYFSQTVTPIQLRYACKYGVKHVIAASWGDDGAECSVFSVLPTMLQYAEICYGEADQKTMEDRCMDCFGIRFEDFMKLDLVGKPDGLQLPGGRTSPQCYEKMALYNDVMLGILDADMQHAPGPDHYRKAAKLLAEVPENRYSPLFTTQQRYAKLLAVKTDLSARVKAAYRAGNKQSLNKIIQEEFPLVQQLLEQFHEALRMQWHTYNKPFGFEIQDMRNGGLKERLHTAQMRIAGYLEGKLERLEELEQPELPFNASKKPAACVYKWKNAYTAGRLAH